MRKTGFFKAKRLTNGGCTSELFEVIGNRFDNPELWRMKTMNENLKSCPFCGGRAKMMMAISPVSIQANSPAVLVQCTGCYAEMHKIIIPYTDDYTSFERKAKELAEKWNKRCEQ